MTADEVSRFEKLLAQLDGLHSEIASMAKKAPNDGVNAFKLKLVNAMLAEANAVLGPTNVPFDDFQQFDADDVPTNSDVSMIVAQYIECAEKVRADNIHFFGGQWWWYVNGETQKYRTSPPKRIGGR